MTSRVRSTLLLLLSACATPAPPSKTLNQVAIPIGPLIAPRPVVMPAPLGLTPPIPVIVDPKGQLREPPTDGHDAPNAAQSEPASRQEPGTRQKSPPDRGPPPALTSERRPECVPLLKPHLGGDALHDLCADNVPGNDARGFDVLVNGKRFDALQRTRRVLWEMKTDSFDTFTPALQRIVIRKQLPELQRERDLARACGYQFRVGVRSAAHLAALSDADRTLDIILMDWC